jgi:enoyl-CoA hydratase/carnithine racemase
MSFCRRNNRFLNAIETGPKPVIAAINGNCLGGGLEIAMACHYRVAAQGVNLGQPEVQIGLIPGAGGTQRLPRLVGLRYGLEMITIGKPIRAEVAHSRRTGSTGKSGSKRRQAVYIGRN